VSYGSVVNVCSRVCFAVIDDYADLDKFYHIWYEAWVFQAPPRKLILRKKWAKLWARRD